MPARPGRRGRDRLRLLAAVYGIGASGTVLYWAGFVGGPARTDQSEEYLAFERSFVLADAYLAAVSGAAAVACWRRDRRALPLGSMASSAAIYLGCMDVLYNLRHRKYRHLTLAMRMEVAINAYCLGVSAWTARHLWQQRDRLA